MLLGLFVQLVMRLQSQAENRVAEDGGQRGRKQSKSGVGNATSVASMPVLR